MSAIPTRIALRIAVAEPICSSKSVPVIVVDVGHLRLDPVGEGLGVDARLG